MNCFSQVDFGFLGGFEFREGHIASEQLQEPNFGTTLCTRSSISVQFTPFGTWNCCIIEPIVVFRFETKRESMVRHKLLFTNSCAHAHKHRHTHTHTHSHKNTNTQTHKHTPTPAQRNMFHNVHCIHLPCCAYTHQPWCERGSAARAQPFQYRSGHHNTCLACQ